MRLIDADALINELTGVEVRWWTDGGYTNYDDTTITEIINNLPTIEAVPVVHGEWIAGKLLFDNDVCSVCGTGIYNTHEMNFCPNCGAKMDGKVV
jgi:ribosomal protein S27AE